MERQRWCLAILGLVLSVFFLATQSEMAPMATFIFCCGVLIANIWLKTTGTVIALAAGLMGDFFLDPGQFPWMLFVAQVSLAISAILANALLAFPQAPSSALALAATPIPEKQVEPMLYVDGVAPVLPNIERVVEKEIVIQREIVVEYQKEYVEVPDVTRLHLLNEIRSTLWEKELLIDHLITENKKLHAHLNETSLALHDLRVRMDQHPAHIAHRELRKQFSEKADALHQIRTQMFSLEGEFLILQREQEEVDCENTKLMADLMVALGEAEAERDQQEEHIMALEQYVKRTLPKRAVRRKKDEGQVELFAAIPSPVKPSIGRNRKKRSTSSLYLTIS